MPYRTKSGTHYHETYGCCGATEACSGEGLEPCQICCGEGSAESCHTAGSPVTGKSQFPRDGNGGTGIFVASGDPREHDHVTVEGHDTRVTDVPTIRHEATDDYVMRLADSLLAIKASMDAARDGQYAPGSDDLSLTSDVLRSVIDRLPTPTTGPMEMGNHDISPEDLVGEPMTPREAFDRRRQDEFLDDFRRRTAEAIRRWNDDGWEEWRAAKEELAQYMKGNLRRERPPEYSRFIDEEVESLLRRRYEDAVPCPDWHLASMWQRHGRLLSGREDLWPGYDEAKREWDAESDRIWDAGHGGSRRDAQDSGSSVVTVA